MPLHPLRLQAVVVLLAVAGGAGPAAGVTGAAAECRWTVETGSADAPQASRHQLQQLRVGDIARPLPVALLRVRNQGPHDIRLSFDGAPPRVLQQGQAEPARGALAAGVRLTQVECLATRVPAAAAHPPGPRLAAAHHIDEHRV